MQVLEGGLEVDDLNEFIEHLGTVGDDHDVTVQAFDARYVAGRRHLERAVSLADRAISRGENVARDRAVEILLYAAGRRQIDRALEMGVSDGENEAVIVVDGLGGEGEDWDGLGGEDDGASEDEDGNETLAREALADRLAFEPTPTLETPDEETLCSFFEITAAERAVTDASLEDLVCERVALLEVEK